MQALDRGAVLCNNLFYITQHTRNRNTPWMTGMRLQYKTDPCPLWDVNEVARVPADNWGTLSLALWNRVAFTLTLLTPHRTRVKLTGTEVAHGRFHSHGNLEQK